MCEPEPISIGCLVTTAHDGKQLIGRVIFRIVSSGTVVIKTQDPKNAGGGIIVEVPEGGVKRVRI